MEQYGNIHVVSMHQLLGCLNSLSFILIKLSAYYILLYHQIIFRFFYASDFEMSGPGCYIIWESRAVPETH